MSYLKIRDYRIKRGLTLKQVGDATFYSWSAIERAEMGKLYNSRKRKDYRTQVFWQAMSDFYGISIPTLRRWVHDDN